MWIEATNLLTFHFEVSHPLFLQMGLLAHERISKNAERILFAKKEVTC